MPNNHPHRTNHGNKKFLLLIAAIMLIAAAVLLALRAILPAIRGTEPVPEVTGAEDAPEAPLPAGSPAPTPEPTPEPAPEPTPDPWADTDVRISEAAAVNTAMIADRDGAFPDWLELTNYGGSSVDLSGWFLSDKESEPERWRIPDGTTLAPGAQLLVFASGKESADGELHASFSLSAGETVFLTSPGGDVKSTLSLAGLSKGEAAVLTDKGTEHSRFVTPGYPNTDEGRISMEQQSVRSSPLLINEVVTSNANSLNHYGKGYFDWVEVRNVSAEPVDISQYYLSDDEDSPRLWQLPHRTLWPGEAAAYLCSGDESLSELYFTHTNFKLDGTAESLFLYKEDGTLCDYVYLHDIPFEGSIGRAEGQPGFWYFPTTSPHHPNTDVHFRCYTPTPVALTGDGVFEGVESVEVELAGEGDIYYTTDGSVPTAQSTPYTGPFTVTETCVIRAACVEEGKLTSRPLTLSYIINEGHTLPVASLVANPGDLWGGGIYDNCFSGNQEQASLSFYEEDGSFTTNCGIRMFGHTGLNLPKKSFKILFRPRFGATELNYDLFDSDVDSFTSLVLRSGQDYTFSIFRDELFGELCADFTDKVLCQMHRYCALYINGRYWGIYCFKEAFSEDYYAAHEGVSSESVTVQRAPVALGSEFQQEVLQYCLLNDMTVPENYEHFCSLVDIDSLIDWAIIEGYSANADVQQNLRYFRSTENGNRWQYAFYDLDWAFYYDINNLSMVLHGIGEDGSTLQHSMYIMRLLPNPEFRDKFCTRLAEALSGPLSPEHVLEKIDELAAELAPEVPRERQRWPGGDWEGRVQELRDFVNNDWTRKVIDGACAHFGLTREQREAYFGEIEHKE